MILMTEPTEEEAMGIAAIREIAMLRTRLERYRQALEEIPRRAKNSTRRSNPLVLEILDVVHEALAPDASKKGNDD